LFKATGQILNFYEIYEKKWTHFDELLFPQKKQRGRNIFTGNHVDIALFVKMQK
jgi:hypothetical protein